VLLDRLEPQLPELAHAGHGVRPFDRLGIHG
jgi:hypothetical protein